MAYGAFQISVCTALFAGPAIHNHLHNILPPMLALASSAEPGKPGQAAATDALHKVAGAVSEEGTYLLVAQWDRALEDPLRRRAAADAIKHFCTVSQLDFQEHVPALITVRDVLQARIERAGGGMSSTRLGLLVFSNSTWETGSMMAM